MDLWEGCEHVDWLCLAGERGHWHCCKYSVEPSCSIRGGKLLTSWPPASFSRNLFWGIIFVAVITSRCLKFVTRDLELCCRFYIVLCNIIFECDSFYGVFKAWYTNHRVFRDRKNACYWSVRDLLAFIGSSAETKCVSAVVWDVRVVLLAKFGHIRSLFL